MNGKKIEIPDSKDCYEVGKMVGNLHTISKSFNEKKENILNLIKLKKIFNKCLVSNTTDFKDILDVLISEIKFLENSWPNDLPSGIIHADLFRDNIFFNEGKITGVIDFYFSCYHFFLYDISIVVNDWCFKNDGKDFNNKFFDAIIRGYVLSRKLNKSETDSFNLTLRIASTRILITRLHDYIFQPNSAIVIKKDPYEYFNILKWHQNNRIIIKQ